MSYTVLARKWRPRQFDEMIGQEHVLRALVNALDGDRLHHAYLFTGTRGVGKTTVARILAKALNCETGVTAKPCGECGACTDIDRGRFIDLLEVDAASRTKVDDTRELLDNVQYAPTHGRFKVYLIDEVHMLSTHSFNALLKTLEEPPPHVKFLLATTDPQKLPVTVLSRCLQFNLKRLQPGAIAAHLAKLCVEEGIEADEQALALLANAAQGSVRDGLSLLDQAIAYGGGRVETAEVAEMLGTIDRQQVLKLLHALADGDGAALLARVATMDERAPDWAAALAELAGLLQRVAVQQVVGEGADAGAADAAEVAALAARLTPEDVQLHYQIALLGRRDLDLAPDPRGAFEMTLLRMLAFRPGDEPAAPVGGGTRAAAAAPAAGAGRSPEVTAAATPRAAGRPEAAAAAATPPTVPAPVPDAANSAPAQHRGNDEAAAPVDDWAALLRRAGLGGAALQLASHCVLQRREGHVWHLLLDPEGRHMNTAGVRTRLEQALREALDGPVELRIADADAPPADTPAREQARHREQRQRRAEEALQTDPNVLALKETFDATLHLDTVRTEGENDR